MNLQRAVRPSAGESDVLSLLALRVRAGAALRALADYLDSRWSLASHDRRPIERMKRESAAGGRLRFVDGLRGIAAMMVVLYHLAGRTSADWLVSKGYLGVSVFFVLSGFVITMAIGERKVTAGFLGRFAARRSLRLDPPYWTSIAIAIALMLVAARMGIPKELPGGTAILAHLFYLQDILGLPAISDVYWSLCLEIQFYLFLMVLLWICGQRVGSGGFKALLGALLVLSLVQQANLLELTPRGVFLPYWYGFAAGSVTYWTSVGRLSARYFAGTLLVLLAFAPFAHGEAVLVTALTVMSLHVASRLWRMQDWLSGPVTQFLGRTSYSLYLFHALIGWSAQSFALRFVNQWAALAIGMTSSILFAAAAYVMIERPAIRLSHVVRMDNRA
ncbi:MAG: acyltransferase [Thermomicrobiales bacterium]|nr:MAG: acyltransferase [Thermomicrobiales bacterium]